MVRDPRDCADKEAYHVDQEMRRQRRDCVDHLRTVGCCPDVLQMDVENEQCDREGDDAITERFNLPLGIAGRLKRREERELIQRSA